MKRMIKRAQQKLAGLGKTVGGKVAGASTAVVVGASNANAAVTFSDTTGFAGAVDLNFFYSAVPLVVTAMVAVAAVGLGIKMFKRV